MSRLDELITELCPDGVEHKALGDCIVKNVGGGTPRKSQADYWNGSIPWASVKDIVKQDMYLSDTEDYITEKGLSNSTSNLVQQGEIIVATRINPGKMLITKMDVAINQDLRGLILNDWLDAKYLVYYFQTLTVVGRGTTVKGISVRELERIKIPVPPLPIQREIVRILDDFMGLTAELKAKLTVELTARKNQYVYYRQLLLTFDDSVKWMTLGGISRKVSSGGTPLRSRPEYYGGDIPWLRTQEVLFNDITETENSITEEGLNNSSAKWIPKNCVIVAISGATAARCAISKIPLTTNQHCCNLDIDESVAFYRFVFHWVCHQYQKLKALGRGARADLNADIISDFPIPIPALAKQERIVAILDRLDARCNDLTSSLSAEIEVRRKQYEYYRDKLLTFEEEK